MHSLIQIEPEWRNITKLAMEVPHHTELSDGREAILSENPARGGSQSYKRRYADHETNFMNWEAIGAMGEIVGALAVVASLLYLAQQTKANAAALRANAAWDAEKVFADINHSIARDPVFTELLSRAIKPDSTDNDFTETELAQVHYQIRSTLQNMQAQHALWKEGALSDEYWERRRSWTSSLVCLPVANPVWKSEIAQNLIDLDFKDEIERELNKDPFNIEMGKSAKGT